MVSGRDPDELERLEKLALFVERMNLHDFIEQQQRPWQLLWRNLLVGITRGFGIVIGATLLVTLTLALLATAGGLPYVGDFFEFISQSIRQGSE